MNVITTIAITLSTLAAFTAIIYIAATIIWNKWLGDSNPSINNELSQLKRDNAELKKMNKKLVMMMLDRDLQDIMDEVNYEEGELLCD